MEKKPDDKLPSATKMKPKPKTGMLKRAMLEIQKVMGPALKNKDNPFFKSKYSDLKAVNEVINTAMHESNSFVLIEQFVSTDHVTLHDVPMVLVRTVITEVESGESESDMITAFPKENTVQAIGSTITYLRRYSLMARFNISTEDDDGNAGSGKNDDDMDQRRPKSTFKPHTPPPASQTAGNGPKTDPVQPLTQTSGGTATQNPPPKATTHEAVFERPTEEDRKANGFINEDQLNMLNQLLKMAQVKKTPWLNYLKAIYGIDNPWRLKVEWFKAISDQLVKDPTKLFKDAVKP